MNPRERVLNLLAHQEIDRIPCFSGMGNVLMEGMKRHGFKFKDVHKDSHKMAFLAASTFKLTGFECAVVPFDVNLEAEALGSRINYHETSSEEIVYPTVSEPIIEIGQFVEMPSDLVHRGRIPMILEVIRLLHKDIGNEVAIGSYVMGPYTLAGALTDLDSFLKFSSKSPNQVKVVLEGLVEIIVTIAQTLKRAGVDYITVREMGATSDLISPRTFKTVVFPFLETTLQQIDSPKILHICGNTIPILQLMKEVEADAISIGQKNDVAQTRATLGDDVILLGNIDGFGTLTKGSPEEIKLAVKDAIKSGVNAIWPACDIWPTASLENMKALVEATKEFGNLS